MATSTLLAPEFHRFQIQNHSLGLAWSHGALRLHYVRAASRHRLSDVPRLPSAGHRRPRSPDPAYSSRNLRSFDRPNQFLLADPPASPPTPSHPRPHLRHLRVCWLLHGDRSRGRPPRSSRNLHAGRCLDGLHHRGPHHRAQPPNHTAPPMDGPLLRRYLHVRLQSRAEPLASLLEPSRRFFAAVGVIAFTLASLLIVEIGLNWRELTTRRV